MTLSYIPSDTNDEGVFKATASGSLPSGKPVIVNVDGTVSAVAETAVSQAVGTPVVWQSARKDFCSATFDSNSNKVVIAYKDRANSDYGTAIVGTVDPSDNSISYGTPVVFESANSTYFSSTFDSASNKVVIAYIDNGNSNYGTAIVGTVSNTSISFGSAVVFESADTFIPSATFDNNSNKVVIAYSDVGNQDRGTAIVGTVSNTSISFGSAVVFDSTGATGAISSTFDSASNKVVIAYSDAGSSDKGTAIVGTVSSTSISFGSAVVFEAGATTYISSTFDSLNNKVVIAYKDGGNSNKGTAIVGTVSSTSISFGSAVVFEEGATTYISSAFDSTANKVVIAYRDGGNSNYGTLSVGTVSGTSISFSSAVVFEDSASEDCSSTFDSLNNKVVIAYKDGGNSSYGTAVVFQNAFTAINLTTENYIGVSTGGTYASGSNATVKIIGNTSNEQSSLTAGQSYFVQTDGTIGTTADDPSVFAGTAISATKLLVKT